MKILTWNLYRANHYIEATINTIVANNPDIACLQEVTEGALKKINNLLKNHCICSANQVFYHKNRLKTIKLFNVIIIKKSINVIGSNVHVSKRYNLPLIYRYRYRYIDDSNISISIDYNGKLYRIYNIHLQCVASPSYRLDTLRKISLNIKTDDEFKNILCGDFNTFSSRLSSLFVGYFLGYRISDFMINERKIVSAFLHENGFSNIFYGTNTFKKFYGQFDYICTPKDVRCLERAVLKCRFSDHYGLMLRLAT